MLKLKDVSKFYYNKGIISTGFNKITTDFDLGEFIAITGESGSGKSTLLNVISGTDSYEEGEMYINGEETSHYTEIEFEDYRKKYISNIFQSFNLVNSYTVYQNIELVLLINGYKKKEVKEKIHSILKEVNLLEFRKTKVSKLSGGQKQRVAIARALAKQTPIIIADEPTGNLDTASAASVLDVLHKISKDKLVIVVTHNYNQIEKYVTRKIKMHDGKIIEDKVITKPTKKEEPVENKFKDISFINKLRLGIRNTFNIIPKFLLIFAVYFFIIFSLFAEYSTFKKAEYENNKSGYNQFFNNTDDNRIVLTKKDKTSFTDEDYNKINEIDNIDYLVKDDLVLDANISFSAEESHIYLYGTVADISRIESPIDKGRMPETPNEMVIYGPKKDYYISNMADQLLGSEFKLQNSYTGSEGKGTYKIVGIIYKETSTYGNYLFYVGEEVLNTVKEFSDSYYSSIEFNLSGKVYETNSWDTYLQITPNNKIAAGTALISNDFNYSCANYNCKNKMMTIKNSNIYYELNKEIKITNNYNKTNFSSLTGLSKFEENNGRIFVNPNDYESLFNREHFQSSIFVKDIKNINTTNKELEKLGLKTLMIKDTLVNWDESLTQVLKILELVVTVILIVVMFFISYFIIKIILKSRNIYFTTIRILGASKKVSKQLLDIELLIIANLTYIIILAFLLLNKYQMIKLSYIKDLVSYIRFNDYIMVYLIIIIMTQLISSKFAKSLFKKSAMKTFSEVV